ncbi:MAG: DUF4097 family beta strand repeat-containing protein [bacterium]
MMSLHRLAIALALPALLHAQAPERVSLDGRDVAIYNLVGTLQVEGGTGDRVVVDVTRRGRDAGRLRLETGNVRGRATLRVVYPADRILYVTDKWTGRTTFTVAADGTWGDGDNGSERRHIEVSSRGDGLDAHADLKVTVPKGRALSLWQGVGETTIENVDGQIVVNAAAARVRVAHVRGALRLDTGSGGVDVSDATGDVTIDAGSGGATLDGIRGGSLHMDLGSGSMRGRAIDVRELIADVGSGGIHLSGVKTPTLHLDSGSGGTDIELLAAPDDVAIDGGSGGVTLRLPASTSATVDIETGSGGIESDFDVKLTRVERRALRGTIGTGKGRIKIESGSGSVRLLRS